MSQTATKIDPKTHLAGWTRQLTGMYANDLKAIDEANYANCPGGCARTVQDVTAEVIGFNYMIAAMLKGESPSMPSEEERAAFTAKFATTEACIGGIKDSGEALASALESASDETLASDATAPWGDKMPLYSLANIAANHILYHDGQLNYIQSLHGDGKMHWFE
ncbi:MAG: hypothetical protein KF784_10830 [Fimbriimonadaceae bacterium]|nr:hypothetical protein [Fimbriimonadaceae bacterium]